MPLQFKKNPVYSHVFKIYTLPCQTSFTENKKNDTSYDWTLRWNTKIWPFQWPCIILHILKTRFGKYLLIGRIHKLIIKMSWSLLTFFFTIVIVVTAFSSRSIIFTIFTIIIIAVFLLSPYNIIHQSPASSSHFTRHINLFSCNYFKSRYLWMKVLGSSEAFHPYNWFVVLLPCVVYCKLIFFVQNPQQLTFWLGRPLGAEIRADYIVRGFGPRCIWKSI